MEENKIINIIFAGVGGQGNILVSHLLADAVLEKGQQVRLTETFGAATRGGSVFSCVRIGDAGAPLPRENSCQVIIGLEPLECLRRGETYLAPGGTALINTRPWYPVDATTGRIEYPEVDMIEDALKKLDARVISFDATELALQAGAIRMMNIVMLGGLMALKILKLDNATIIEQMDKRWREEIAEPNKVAFQMGFDYVSKALGQSN
jgi:indolepyruvate ferredoxin oxidoreductase beta subunit